MSQESRLVYPDADGVARAAADELLKRAHECIAKSGVFTLALSGGSTPKKLYALLATDAAYRAFPWDKTQLFFGDERHVPPTHPDSNLLMTQTTLLASNLVPASHVHRVRAEMPDASQAAADYEAQLHAAFPAQMQRGGFPRFDVVLLGMGPDGHTASLFPGSNGLAEKTRWVIANWVEKFKTHRITFTFPVLNAADAVLLLVAGADKADMMHEVLVTHVAKPVYPVQDVKPAGQKIWMLDTAAAARLPQA